MKKVFIVLASLLGIIFLALILIPIIFKDDIQAAIDKEMDNALNAEVYYDVDALSLSLIKSFPNLSLSMSDFGIVGIDQFARDTLFSVKEFNITIDIMSVINGDQIKIVNVALANPNIKVLVLADGTANYDIAKPSEEVVEETEEASAPLAIQIQGWQITDGTLIYDDQTLPMRLGISGLNHSGSGDFALDIFDMITQTTISEFDLSYDGVEYISNKKLNADIIMEMDLSNMKFTFKENKVAINDFGFSFDGFVSMPADDIDMEINYGGKDISLASILSLVPGDYEEYLTGVTANGLVAFEGYVKGTYNDSSMPQVASTFSIADGSIKYADYPIPMNDIQVSAKFDYPSADLRETSFVMDKFHMMLDGEELTAYLLFKDLEDYYWDFRVDGNMDLEKITKIVKLEDMALRGKINAKISTTGRMSDLDAERYELLATTGSISIEDLYYESSDLPQGFGIAESKMTIDPEAINLASFKGNAGKTDLNMDGEITNYLQYALSDSAMLLGQLNFSSSLVDANEWMVADDTTLVEEDTSALEIVRIPENIDFILVSSIDKILYDDLVMSDFNGKLIVKEGAVFMDKVGFNMLGGGFVMNGSYQSAISLPKPLYDFDFAIKELPIAAAFQSFVTVQKLVPVAEKMTGKFSTDFKVGGSLGEDMMPIYEDMQGAGLIKIAQAAVSDVKLLSAVSNMTKLNNSDGEVSLKDLLLSAEIKSGRLYVEPFDMTIGGRKATIGGSTGVDGSLDYAMAMNVPSGQVGDALNSALASVPGMSNAIGNDITMNLGISGTYDELKVKLLSANPTGASGSGVKDALKQQAADKLNEQKEAATAKVEAAKDSVSAVINEKKEEVKEEIKEEVDKAKEETTDKAKDALKGLLKKKTGGG
ncbi:MAG: hypothetical protein ACJA2C_000419 [Marinoscillum sp.]|jgi:uncharacterized protein involved in outer membrane biogenesis